MNNDSNQIYEAEMGFSHIELRRGLESAVVPYDIKKISDQEFLFVLENRTATLTMSPERTRQIASIKLPVIDVKIEFDNFNQTQYAEFLGRFKKYLHRGGG